MKKGNVIADIKQGQPAEGVFFVASKRLCEGKNGPYIALNLMDKTGELEGRIWENAHEADKAFEERDFVYIKGDAALWQGATQVKISAITRLTDEDIDIALFMPTTTKDREELWRELQKTIKKVKSPLFQGLLSGLFRETGIRNAFLNAPAAKRMHHAYLGGLLEHCVSVARLAYAISGLYQHLDRDLLITAAILHDIGKIDELSFERPPIEYSNKGRLIGHLVLGTALIDDIAAKLSLDEESDGLMALKHLILSHHGQREFGAPILPMMEEAIVLHMIDDLDAKINYLDGLKNGIKGPGYGWTEYQRLLDRYFYLRGDSDSEDVATKGASPQMSLWPAENQE